MSNIDAVQCEIALDVTLASDVHINLVKNNSADEFL